MTEDEVREALAKNTEAVAHWQGTVDRFESRFGQEDRFGRRQLWLLERRRDELELMLTKVMYE